MTDPRLVKWQRLTIGTLCVGYAGYYICRSNLSVAAPVLLSEYGEQGLDKATMGAIFTSGTFFYAIGKLFNGVLCDFVGGRRMFLFGMAASVAATVFFGLGTGFIVFAVAWALNRLVQSMGWGALVKVSSNWFPIAGHGRIMGILCLSYLFGDVVARRFQGELLAYGLSWRHMFFACAGVLGAIALASRFLLKSSPRDIGSEEPPANPRNVFGERGNADKPESLLDLLVPFFTSFSFWMVCLMSFGLTVIRETFNAWTPTYLGEVGGLTPAAAAKWSAVFPFFGGLSVLVAGFLTDKLTTGRRGAIMLVFLSLATLGLMGLSQVRPGESTAVSLILISAVGFFMIGPYGFLTGVISLDLGGRRGSSTAAGLVDAVGYGGGMLSGIGIGALAQRSGWAAAFAALTAMSVVTVLAAGLYWWHHERRPTSTRAPAPA